MSNKIPTYTGSAGRFVRMGSTHLLCQDYAVHGMHRGHPYCVIADGCSGAPSSEVGALLLTKSAECMIKAGMTIHDARFGPQVIRHAARSARMLGIPFDSLQATLLAAQGGPDKIHTFVAGDGMIIAKARHSKTPLLVIREYEFAGGAPYYLRYSLNARMAEQFRNMPNNEYRRYWHTLIGNDFNSLIGEVEVESIIGTTHPHVSRWDTDSWEWVAVVTDGLKSFVKSIVTDTSRTSERFDLIEAIGRLFDFKSYQGDFVERSMNWAFKQFTKDMIANHDDFASGVICYQEENAP